ncbi:sugar transporter [Coemansia mojavensis]|nr:sugar transporter [Coemansia mojavensis]
MVAAATENTALLNTSHSATDRKPANFSRRSLPPPSSSPERPSSRSSSSEYNSSAHGERKPLTSWQLMGMTVLLAGIQFVWTVELGYGTPYLLSLGLSKPLMTLVWMAGPLSGLLIQPIVGRLSDKCASSLGRRRPYIIGGAAFVITSVIMIAYAKEAAVALARLSGVSEDNGQVTRTSIVIAVVGFYVLDFSINTSQACARALALDIPPLQQQDLANAYAGRMLNLGSVTGYMVGFMDLRAIIPWKTDSQMQALCLIATAVFAITITWTCLAVREVPLQGVSEWADMFGSIVRGVTKLPTPVQRVCNVQFFAWVAWFPFLFFATTWVTEVMSRTGDPKDPEFIERATRAGSFALFLYSIASLGFSMILPAFVEDESNASSIHNRPSMFKVSLRTMWRMSLTAMCVILMMTYFVADVRGATILIVSMAFPWALAMWAPFALVGEYVAIASEHPQPMQFASEDYGSALLRYEDEEVNHTDDSQQQHEKLESGTILGIHNMYVVFPQFVINAVSSLVFAWLGSEPTTHSQGSRREAVGWVLRIGGASALIAAMMTFMLFDRQRVRAYVVQQNN